MPSEDKVIPVRVALRSRPLVPKEIGEGCQSCLLFVAGEPQVTVGNNKSFTYDFAFGPRIPQEDVYQKAVSPLVKGIFKGYNATVLAYGQTGSGKTHTMGSGYSTTVDMEEELIGIIPRVIADLYHGIKQRSEYEYVVKASFLEIYNEDLHDLLSTKKDADPLAVREDVNGGIRIAGLSEVVVDGPQEMLDCLDRGSSSRTTASTAMNKTSSRSHAIFTIIVEQNRRDDMNDVCRSKFHLVDLAGSERVKKTHAEGGRFKEGVNINLGLLALGNVISALGDESQKRSHIPYRDSKLTRLLQDSLGGNSHTVMIACVSPADSNMEETINTLRYADRARKIKNKPIVNRDPQAAEILRLKQLVGQLQMNGSTPSGSGSQVFGARISELEAENQKLSHELQMSVDQNTGLCEKVIMLEMARETLKHKLEEIKQQTGLTIENLNTTVNLEDFPELKAQIDNIKSLQQKITDLEKDDLPAQLEVIEEEDERESPVGSMPGSPASNALSAKYALRQAQMGRELQELNKMLNKKQELAEQLKNNDERMDVMKSKYEGTMNNLEKEVSSLQKEKEELQQQLLHVKTNSNTNKLSEQRRQRLKELEAKMSELRRKMLEQSKIVRMKEQTDKQVEKLNQDITGMKHQRVKLMKQMKEDSDTFRKWKQEKDKEIMQLKSKDRKRQCEMVKMESLHKRQQTVLRRKAEEAAAANKRLKEALSKQKQSMEDRQKSFEKKEMTGIGAKVKNFLSQEVEMLVSIKSAQHHLESQINDRKVLTEELAKLKKKLGGGGPPKKKIAWGEQRTAADNSGEDQELKKQINSLEQDIELRNAQITDLQQKLMDADQGDKVKSRWECIHTMVEAKCALKWLLNTAVASKSRESVQLSEMTEMRSSVEENNEKMEKGEQEMKGLKLKHQEEMTNMQREYEEKVLFLLRQLRTAQSDGHNTTLEEEARQRMTFQDNEIAKLSSLHAKLQAKIRECEHYKKELTVAKYSGKLSLMPAFGAQSPFLSPAVVNEEIESDDPNYYPTDDGEESDYWTPHIRRAVRRRPKKASTAAHNTSSGSNGRKRSGSPVPGICSCKGDCSRKICGCRKRGGKCTSDCNCREEACQNRCQDSSEESDNTQSTLNSTFNVADESGNKENDAESHSPAKSPTKILGSKENIQDQKSKKLSKKNSAVSLFKKPSSGDDFKESRKGLLEGGIKKKRKLLGSTTSFFDPPLAV